jgi:hypothetical protein
MNPKEPDQEARVKQWVSRVLIVMVFVMAGCASTQQAGGPRRDVQESGFLEGVYPLMKEGEKGQALRVYRNPRVDSLAVTAYDKVLVDQVTIFYGPESKLNDVPEEELQNLATMFGAELADKLSNDYQLVSEPGPKTLRIQAAITDADETSTALKAASFVPIPLGVPGAKAALLKATEMATGKPVFAGEVTAEMKLTDAQSGDVLFAAMDRRVGERLGGGWESWTDAEEAFRYWAEKVRYGLCTELRRATDCVAPEA